MNDYIVAFKPVYLSEIPKVLSCVDKVNQRIVSCVCGKYYWYEFNDNTNHNLVKCPYCNSNDKSLHRQHSGGYFNSGTF